MGPHGAVATGLRRALDFSGRSGRSEYVWFLAVATAAYAAALWEVHAIFGGASFRISAIVITAIFCVPAISAGVRRLHDAGENGALMLNLLALGLALWLLGCALLLIAYVVPPVFFGTVIAILFFAPLVAFAWVAAIVGTTVMTLVFFSDTFSKLLLPSVPNPDHPTPNRPGPNPPEVPQ